MYIKRETFKKQNKDAREVLIEKGICAIDGSGDSIVEGAMNHLSLFANDKLSVIDPGEIDQLRLLAIEYGIGSWSYQADTGCFLLVDHEEQFTLAIEDMAEKVRTKVIAAKTLADADYNWIGRLCNEDVK